MIHTLTTIGRRKLNSDNKSEHPYGTLAGGRKVGKKTQGPSRALIREPNTTGGQCRGGPRSW